MSDIKVPGFQSSEVFANIKSSFDALPADQKAKLLKQVSHLQLQQNSMCNSQWVTSVWL